ncbi:hypothetical protein WJX73_002198 [Symbiochloris irregularis]|uniref:MutL C-terminal dimerisation domain-containing protein n=1 Tax=Symbiochloris irregularis TaxID=706552 RepID=A0AAW1PTK6_9CHLO
MTSKAILAPTNDAVNQVNAIAAPRTPPFEKYDAIEDASITCPTLIPEVLTRQQLQQGRALAQIDATFIAVATAGVLTIVDQHAADERVKQEQLRGEVLDEQRMPREPVSTPLVPAERLYLDSHQLATLRTHAARVASWGWG